MTVENFGELIRRKSNELVENAQANADAVAQAQRAAEERAARIRSLFVIKDFIGDYLIRTDDKLDRRTLYKQLYGMQTSGRTRAHVARGWALHEQHTKHEARYDDKGRLLSPAYVHVYGFLLDRARNIRQYAGNLEENNGRITGSIILGAQDDAEPLPASDQFFDTKLADCLAGFVIRHGIAIPEHISNLMIPNNQQA